MPTPRRVVDLALHPRLMQWLRDHVRDADISVSAFARAACRARMLDAFEAVLLDLVPDLKRGRAAVADPSTTPLERTSVRLPVHTCQALAQLPNIPARTVLRVAVMLHIADIRRKG